jgi:hypothetical protein
MSKPTIHMSRAFVEFGPITLEEFHTFKKRGILRETDYFRNEGESTWLHVSEFAVAYPLQIKPSAISASTTAKSASTKAATKAKASPKTEPTASKPAPKKKK